MNHKLKVMVQIIYNFLLLNLAKIHCGTLVVKLKASLNIALVISPIAFITEKITDWYLTNQAYILWVCVAILIDWAFGLIKHLFFTKDFDFKAMGIGLLLKLGLAVFAGILFEGLHYFLKEENIVSNSLLIITRLSVFMYPAGSAFMNMAVVSKGVFPPVGWIKKLQAFNENLDLTQFKNGNTSQTN